MVALAVIATVAGMTAVGIATQMVALGSSDPARETASIVFPLFLVALIAAGLRAILRPPHA